MTRVLSVVDRTIMVSIWDVVPGDILFVRGDELDLIVDSVQRKTVDGKTFVRYVYKPREGARPHPPHTIWMDGEIGGRVFVHDLKNERAEFEGEPDPEHILVVSSLRSINNVEA